MHLLALLPGSSPAVFVPLPDTVAQQLAGLWLEPNDDRRKQTATRLLTHEPGVTVWATVQFLCSHRRWPHDVQEVAVELADGVLHRWDGLHCHRAFSANVGSQWHITQADRDRWGGASAELLFTADLIGRCYPGEQASEVRFWTLIHRGLGDWEPLLDRSALAGSFAVQQVEAWSELARAIPLGDRPRQQAAEVILEEGLSEQPGKIQWLRSVAAHISSFRGQVVQRAAADWAAAVGSWSATSREPNFLLTHLLRHLQWANRLDRRFNDALLEAKLDALKEFAYGASHELNNPLANITMRAEALLAEETHPERRRKLATICTQALRASEMIADLMLFVRPPTLEWQRVAVRPLVEQVADELREQAASQGTQLVLRVDDSSPPEFWADPVQVAVALKAICTNALEALGSGGCMEIALTARWENQRRDGEQPGLEIAVRDNGPGLSPRAQRHMFDPFFSGREAGRGLGLGLSKCWRIMSLHGGMIRVESSGLGTAVRLLFPYCGDNPPTQLAADTVTLPEIDQRDHNQ